MMRLLIFRENVVDQCCENFQRKFIIIVLYVDAILLATNDTVLLQEIKRVLLRF